MDNVKNIPNTNQQTVRGNMTVKAFVSGDSPDESEIQKFEDEVNSFLKTIDNQNRFLNGRNSYAIAGRLHILIWYIERIKDTPVTTPFGKNPDDQSNPSQEKKD